MSAPTHRPLCVLGAGALLLATLSGCPPVREDTVGEGSGYGTQLQSAFVATDPWTGSEYELAYIYLVDTDHTCQQIINNYGLDWWNMSSDVTWVTANVYKGQLLEWESTFRSQYSWNQDGNFDYRQADFFGGSYGDGGYDEGDDDDEPPPPGDGGFGGGNDAREQEGSIGVDFVGMEDTLTIRSWSGDRIRGDIQSEAGSWSFDAVFCGDLNGDVVGLPEDGDVGTPDGR